MKNKKSTYAIKSTHQNKYIEKKIVEIGLKIKKVTILGDGPF